MDAIERYMRAHSSPEDDLLAELDRETHRRTVHPRMISGPLQGKLLEMIVRMVRPRNILEIGTFTGYSALCMAAGLEAGARVHTIEADDELEPIARAFFARSPHGEKIRHYTGSALEVAPRLGLRFELVFIDGDKREYPAYYRMLMGDDGTPALVGEGSVLLADNILWYGKVAQAGDTRDRHTAAIDRFNRMVLRDERVENVIVPVRDGMNLIRVKNLHPDNTNQTQAL